MVDESTGQGGDELGEDYLEYDDEEDRLIEQGGIGIPVDEVCSSMFNIKCGTNRFTSEWQPGTIITPHSCQAPWTKVSRARSR